MFSVPKLIVLALLIVGTWWGWRKLSKLVQAHEGPKDEPARPKPIAHDMEKCARCGVFVAAGAGCEREDCPRA